MYQNVASDGDLFYIIYSAATSILTIISSWCFSVGRSYFICWKL